MKGTSSWWRGLTWPALGLAGVLAVVVIPHVGHGRETHVWTERSGSGPVATVPSPAWVEIARAVKPAVVNVSTRGTREKADGDELMREFPGRGLPGREAPGRNPRRNVRGLGSGFVINADGYVLTNNHVVAGASEIRVRLADGREVPGKVVGGDAKTDLALLKVEATGLPIDPARRLGQARGGRAGHGHRQPVRPGADGDHRHRERDGRGDRRRALRRLHPDRRLHQSGQQRRAARQHARRGGRHQHGDRQRHGGSVGIGFAIPSNLVKPIVAQLAESGRVTRAWLGVSIQPVTKELAASFGLPDTTGALVSGVMDGSPAAKAGLKQGDVIVKYDGRPVARGTELPRVVAETAVGREVPLQVVRDGQRLTVTVKVARLEEDGPKVAAAEPAGAKLGIAARALTPEQARSSTCPPAAACWSSASRTVAGPRRPGSRPAM